MSARAVVKLGGSFAAAPGLRPWLDAIAREAGRLVLVPGGGRFADTVRTMQPVMRYGEAAAHRMALLAMEQYAWALADLHPALCVADSADAIAAALAAGRVPVWAPEDMAHSDPALAQTWDVTSDSLALWLARRLGIARLVLIKQAGPPSAYDAPALARAGVIDRAFPDLSAGWSGTWAIAAADDYARLARLIGTPAPVGAAGE